MFDQTNTALPQIKAAKVQAMAVTSQGRWRSSGRADRWPRPELAGLRGRDLVRPLCAQGHAEGRCIDKVQQAYLKVMARQGLHRQDGRARRSRCCRPSNTPARRWASTPKRGRALEVGRAKDQHLAGLRAHDGNARRARCLRAGRDSGRPLLGRADAARLGVFEVGEERFPACLIHAFGLQKTAAARANLRCGALDAGARRADRRRCRRAARRAASTTLPAHVWQTGSGTQTNMNANEVIANRANELLGGAARRPSAGASQRPRQRVAVVERQLPDGDARRGASGTRAAAAARAARAARRRLTRRRSEFARRGEDRPHAPDGRDADDDGPGLRRLCARSSATASTRIERHAAAAVRAGAGRHRGRHRPEPPPGFDAAFCAELARADRHAVRRRTRTSSRRMAAHDALVEVSRRAQDGGGRR